MTKEISIVHHADRRTDVMMPYAPGIVVRRGQLVFLSGVTAAAVYHSHPHRDEEFDLPSTMREQAVLTMENLKKTLEAAGCTVRDLVSATRYLTAVDEQDATTHGIAQNVKQVAQGTSQVAASILDVNKRASETGLASSELLASAQTLARESSKLRNEAQSFLATVRTAS